MTYLRRAPPPRSVLVHGQEFIPGSAGPDSGRHQGDGQFHVLGQGNEQYRERGAELGGKEAGASDHHQGQAAGNVKGGVCSHAEAHAAHPGAAGAGDGAEHARHPGKPRGGGRRRAEKNEGL